MCETCGCEDEAAAGEHVHVHPDGRVSSHQHEHPPQQARLQAVAGVREPVQVQVLARNRALAARNRALLGERRVFAINLMWAVTSTPT